LLLGKKMMRDTGTQSAGKCREVPGSAGKIDIYMNLMVPCVGRKELPGSFYPVKG
jgi:hypothetical protein